MSDLTDATKLMLGYRLPTGYEFQSGASTAAPSAIYADADYEVGDGKCGLHEKARNANEPAIVYVRADTIEALEAENAMLREHLEHEIAERSLLQDILDNRPAINAGLPKTYVDWSQSIYPSVCEVLGLGLCSRGLSIMDWAAA